MSDISEDQIVSAWVANCRDAIEFGSSSETAAKTFWAYEFLDALCQRDPYNALHLIAAILASNPGERVVDNLAAGPLEDLLRRHGLLAVELIRREVLRDPAFLGLLDGVWVDDMNPDVQVALTDLLSTRPRKSGG